MDEFFGQMARALRDRASEPEAFALFLRLLIGHFDRVDLGAGYKQLHTFGVPNGTPVRDLSQAFCVVVSAATGTERVLAPGTEVLEVVRMALNEQYPSLMPTLYPGVLATEPRPFGTLDAMWSAFQVLVDNRTPAINGDFFFPCLLRRRACGHPPRRGPDPLAMGAARAGRLPSRLHGRRVRAIIPS